MACTDYVIQNNILKSLEVLENKARKDWKAKWGFYLEFPNFIIEEAKKLGYSEEDYRRITQRYRQKPTFYEAEPPVISIEPTPSVPKTSSGMIGWRADKKYSLEKFGPSHVNPKTTLPYQPPYYSIFLG